MRKRLGHSFWRRRLISYNNLLILNQIFLKIVSSSFLISSFKKLKFLCKTIKGTVDHITRPPTFDWIRKTSLSQPHIVKSKGGWSWNSCPKLKKNKDMSETTWRRNKMSNACKMVLPLARRQKSIKTCQNRILCQPL